MDVRKIGVGAAVALLVLALWCIWFFQPDRQLRLRQEKLLEAYEERDWETVSKLIADHYSDRWEGDKAYVVQQSRDLFRQFLFLEIEADFQSVLAGEETGEVTVGIRMRGRGGPLATLVMDRVNTFRQPFTFQWEKRSWKPWDWALIRADQPELEFIVRDLGMTGREEPRFAEKR